MNVPKAWFKILWLVSVLGQLYANIDSKEYFCGKKLVRTLTELCSIYNHPTFARNRFRRQIVEECCRSQCSRRYLVQYYCLEANSSVTTLLKAEPENSSKTAHDKDDKRLPDRSPVPVEERNSLTVGIIGESSNSNQRAFSSQIEPLASNHSRIAHRRRSCRCRKRRAKRKNKRRRLQSARNMIQHNYPVPPANIGHVEHSQTPFYVWRFARMY